MAVAQEGVVGMLGNVTELLHCAAVQWDVGLAARTASRVDGRSASKQSALCSGTCYGQQSLGLYTECPRRNVKYFGRVFLMLNYTDITQNTYIQS